MLIEFSLQLQLESNPHEMDVIMDEAETYVAEHYGIRNAQLVNISNLRNPAGPDFTFRAQIPNLSIFKLINKIADATVFGPGDEMHFDLSRRTDPDFSPRAYLYECYSDILNEYAIKILS